MDLSLDRICDEEIMLRHYRDDNPLVRTLVHRLNRKIEQNDDIQIKLNQQEEKNEALLEKIETLEEMNLAPESFYDPTEY